MVCSLQVHDREQIAVRRQIAATLPCTLHAVDNDSLFALRYAPKDAAASIDTYKAWMDAKLGWRRDYQPPPPLERVLDDGTSAVVPAGGQESMNLTDPELMLLAASVDALPSCPSARWPAKEVQGSLAPDSLVPPELAEHAHAFGGEAQANASGATVGEMAAKRQFSVLVKALVSHGKAHIGVSSCTGSECAVELHECLTKLLPHTKLGTLSPGRVAGRILKHCVQHRPHSGQESCARLVEFANRAVFALLYEREYTAAHAMHHNAS